MPKIKINEVDYTSVSTVNSNPNIVYIPGLAGINAPKEVVLNTPTLCENLKQFKELFGDAPSLLTVGVYDKSYIMAYELLNLGLSVCYEALDATSIDTIKEKLNQDSFWEKLSDRGLYSIRFLTMGGYPTYVEPTVTTNIIPAVACEATLTSDTEIKEDEVYYTRTESDLGIGHLNDGEYVYVPVESPVVDDLSNYYIVSVIGSNATTETVVGDDNKLSQAVKSMLKCAEQRGECTALVDHTETTPTIQKQLENVKLITTEVGKESGKYAASFTPWCKINLTSPQSVTESTVVNFTSSQTLPASYAYLASFANSTISNPNWFAIAGSKRGIIPKLDKPLTKFGELEANALQSRDDGDISINPICLVNPYGYIIWGNRTLNPINGNLTASDFLNIRQLITDIKKQLFIVSRALTFEQNTNTLWNKFKSMITPLLERMQTSQGIEGFKLTKVNSDEKGTVYAKIKIIPIEAVEDFTLDVELADSLSTVTE